MLLQGRQSTNDQALKPFQSRKNELSVRDDCILWDSCVLIPPQGCQNVIDEFQVIQAFRAMLTVMFGGLEWMQTLNLR